VCEEDLIGTGIDVCTLKCVTNGREDCWDNRMCTALSTIANEVVAEGCTGPDVCGGGECRFNSDTKTLLCDTSTACRSAEGLNTCCEFPCVEADSPVIPVFELGAQVDGCEDNKMCIVLSSVAVGVDTTACTGPDDCAGGECRYNTNASALQCDDGLLLCEYACVEPDGNEIPV
jgi:hypothetical protein